MLSIIEAAGWPIWLIIITSVITLAIIGERFWSLRTSLVAPPVAPEVHARRSPWMISISLIAWLSISTTRMSTRLRKWR